MNKELIGSNLKFLRKTLKISNSEFCKQMTVSMSAMKFHELGRVTLDVLIKYKNKFGISLDDLCFKDLKNSNNMKTIKQVSVTVEHVELMPDYDSSKENVIYVSIKYGVAIHKCLCGCKGKTVTPLGKNEWTLIENEKGVTMTPSLLNSGMDCKSHYIITNGVANFV